MKKYPKIYYYQRAPLGSFCYAFDKIDGSNIRTCWDRKLSKKTISTNGFGKFGSRNQLIKNINETFGEAVDIFMDKYSEELDRLFRTHKRFRGIEKIMVYGEFFGENSFAGQHLESDVKDLVVFDIELYKKGFLPPKEFLQIFEEIDKPKVIYQGEFNSDLINSIRNNEYQLSEGVICKGVENSKVWMAKIKTNDWLKKVKDKLGESTLKEELKEDLEILGTQGFHISY